MIKKTFVNRCALGALLVGAGVGFSAAAQDGGRRVIELRIKNHKFDKEEIRVKDGELFTLRITNEDPTSEEFESNSLIVEKFIGPKRTLNVQLGPYKKDKDPAKNKYDYMGEFHQATAKGVLIVE